MLHLISVCSGKINKPSTVDFVLTASAIVRLRPILEAGVEGSELRAKRLHAS